MRTKSASSTGGRRHQTSRTTLAVPPVADPAIPVAPPPADTDSVEIVEEGVRPALASSDAQELLDSLRDKLAVHDDLQLTLSWRLERRRKG